MKIFSGSKCIISIPWFFNYGIIQSKYNIIYKFNYNVFMSNYISEIYYNNIISIQKWGNGHEIMMKSRKII